MCRRASRYYRKENAMIRLGPYQLVDILGEGGLGQVWRGVHDDHPHPVAVKVLSARKQLRPIYEEALANELRAMARLEHPAIVQLLDAGTVGQQVRSDDGLFPTNTPYLVMEYAELGSLTSLARAMAWPQIEALLFVALSALAHAHARGVIHRDLKPENFLLGWTGGGKPVRLTDFGLAVLHDLPDDPLLGWGTPQYMAPEQYASRLRDQGPWTDLFALGCMAFELIAHQPALAFDREARRRLLRPFVPRMDIPGSVAPWLGGLLHNDPRRRFSSATHAAWALAAVTGRAAPMALQEAEDRLAQWLHALPQGAAPPPAAHRTPSTDLTTLTGTAASPENQALLPLEPWHPDPPPPPRIPRPATWLSPPDTTPRRHGIADENLFAHRGAFQVGRAEERAKIWEVMGEVCLERQPRVISLRGGSGVGKSQLLRWIGQQAAEAGVAAVIAVRHEESTPLEEGLVGALRGFLGLGEGSTPQDFDRLPELWRPPEHEERLALLSVLCPPPQPEHEAPSHLERYALLLRQLERVGCWQPLVIALDDAHFAAEALFFVRHVLRREGRGELPVLFVLATSAAELEPRRLERVLLEELEAAPKVLSLELGPMEPETLLELLSAHLPLAPELARLVAQRSQGLPSFALQLLSELLARGAIERRGQVLVAPSLEGEALPRDLHELWLERAQAYRAESPSGWPALEVAALLGLHVQLADWRLACRRLGILSEPELLAEWQRRGLADVDQELNMARLAAGQLREAILEVAQQEERWHESNACLAQLVAPHDHERRARYHLASGSYHAAVADLLAAAEGHLGRGELLRTHRLLDWIDSLLERHLSPLNCAFSQMLRASCYDLQGMYIAALSRGEEAARAAQRCGAHELAERAQVVCAFALLHQGKTEVARVRFEAIATVARSPRALLSADVGRARVAQRRGELRQAGERFEACLDRARDTHQTYLEGICLNGLGDIARQAGDLEGAAAHTEGALALFERLGHRVMVADCLNDLAELARLRQDHATAMELCRRSIATFESAESRLSHRARLGMAYVSLGLEEFDRARALLERLEVYFRESGDYGQLAMAVVATLPILARLGDPHKLVGALRHAKRLLEITGRRDHRVAHVLEMVRALAPAVDDLRVQSLIDQILAAHVPAPLLPDT